MPINENGGEKQELISEKEELNSEKEELIDWVGETDYNGSDEREILIMGFKIATMRVCI